jgi:hypothetical protein
MKIKPGLSKAKIAHIKKHLKPFKKNDPRINRKGAPKKVVRLQRMLEELFGIVGEDAEAIQKSDVAKILLAVAKRAKRGDTRAADLILDRMYGKPAQVIATKDMPAITIKHNVIKK